MSANDVRSWMVAHGCSQNWMAALDGLKVTDVEELLLKWEDNKASIESNAIRQRALQNRLKELVESISATTCNAAGSNRTPPVTVHLDGGCFNKNACTPVLGHNGGTVNFYICLCVTVRVCFNCMSFKCMSFKCLCFWYFRLFSTHTAQHERTYAHTQRSPPPPLYTCLCSRCTSCCSCFFLLFPISSPLSSLLSCLLSSLLFSPLSLFSHMYTGLPSLFSPFHSL